MPAIYGDVFRVRLIETKFPLKQENNHNQPIVANQNLTLIIPTGKNDEHLLLIILFFVPYLKIANSMYI